MSCPEPSDCDPFTAIVVWIERQLDQPLTLAQIAAQAGFSPYHFSRLFTARMGRSVMAHVRSRRLAGAARRLCVEPDLKLVDLALDCGFDSQEAFTRSFKRMFGVAPGRFRKGFSATTYESPPMNLPRTSPAAVTRLPDILTLPALRVAGPAAVFDDETKSGIPQLWPRLLRALPFDGQLESWSTYGVVSRAAGRGDGCFQYMAGVGVEPGCVPPPGFSALDIPAATYAVFRITLDGTALHPQIKQAMAVIWGELLPASGLKVIDGPDFEVYDGRQDLQTPGACIDFHVPVQMA